VVEAAQVLAERGVEQRVHFGQHVVVVFIGNEHQDVALVPPAGDRLQSGAVRDAGGEVREAAPRHARQLLVEKRLDGGLAGAAHVVAAARDVGVDSVDGREGQRARPLFEYDLRRRRPEQPREAGDGRERT